MSCCRYKFVNQNGKLDYKAPIANRRQREAVMQFYPQKLTVKVSINRLFNRLFKTMLRNLFASKKQLDF